MFQSLRFCDSYRLGTGEAANSLLPSLIPLEEEGGASCAAVTDDPPCPTTTSALILVCIYSPHYIYIYIYIYRYPIVYIFTNGWYSGYHQGYNSRGLDVYVCIYHLLEIHSSLVYSHPQTLTQPCAVFRVLTNPSKEKFGQMGMPKSGFPLRRLDNSAELL